MDPARVVLARKRIARDYGRDLADKASDRFCLALSESLERRPSSAVVEFDPDVITPTNLESTGSGRATDVQTLLSRRRKTLERLEEDFEQAVEPVRTRLERLLKWKGGPEQQDRVTEICVLNRSLRAPFDPVALAEIASENIVRRIGVPRRLVRESAGAFVPRSLRCYRDETGLTGKGVIIALLDSEAECDHPALAGRLERKEKYTKEDWGQPDAHGTAVAGILAANQNGFQGAAPGAIVYNYKVMDSFGQLPADDVAACHALGRAIRDGARIANCSWGIDRAGDGTSREARAFDEAWKLGLTIVKSAGNDGPDATTITSPGDAEGVIVVGACNLEGSRLERYSSRGPTGSGQDRPHLLAPGGSRKCPPQSLLPGKNVGVMASPGTSYAAPYVAGFVALLLEEDPLLAPDELRKKILGMCTRLSSESDKAQGAGVLFALP